MSDATETISPRKKLEPKEFTVIKPSVSNASAKRLIDVTFSFLALLILAPSLFVLVAIIILLDSRGPVFFTQLRTGKNGQSFVCWKFRTMTSGEGEKNDHMLVVTKIGKFLRKSHIDELPQLWNVLKGEMSLVGPRPHMLSDTALFEKRAPEYHQRHAVLPGITGLAQVQGYFGHVADDDHLTERIRLDIEYVQTWTILGDMAILFKTIKMHV
jgi:putative colanic acid biosysnthesis UDP-glucose lipid carrier transferase